MDWTMEQINQVIAAGPYRDDWDSLLSPPGAGMVYQGKIRHFYPLGRLFRPSLRQRVVSQEHVSPGLSGIRAPRENLRPPQGLRLQGLYPLFCAERFDPAAWAELFREAGAQYVVPVAEHHDGIPDVQERYFPLERR